MIARPRAIYEFGSFRIDARERLLLSAGRPVPLTPKAFDTLLALVEHSGRIVTKDDLLRRVWPDTVVEESTLAQNIFTLRRALGTGDQEYIQTIPKHGYRFVAAVRELQDQDAGAAPGVTHPGAALNADAAHAAAPIETAVPESTVSRGAEHAPVRLARPRLRLSVFLLLALPGGLLVSLFYFWLLRGGGDSGTPVTAVLPFRPISAANRDEYLELGMADALITKLSTVSRIVVRPTSAVRKYAGLDQDPSAAGRDLRVESVLDGSVQHVGDRIRVTARLVRVADGRTIWAGTFDEKFTDIFAVQDSISQQIARELAPRLTGKERQRLTKRYTDNPGAYQAYLIGRFFWNKRTEDGLRKAIEHFEQAIRIDPAYALAHAGLAETYVLLNFYSALPIKEAFARAGAAAERALDLDESLAEAHTALAHVKYSYEWDWTGAEAEFRRAIEINPNYATGHQWYAEFLALMGRTDESLTHIRRAQELDPLSIIITAEQGYAYMFARRCDEAVPRFRRALEMDPDFPAAVYYLGRCFEQQSRFDDAIAAYRRAIPLFRGNPIVVGALGDAYAGAGRTAEARQVLLDLTKLARERPVSSSVIATIYAGLGEKDEAFAWLERAYKERDDRLELLKVDPHLDPLRSDPRFAELLRRVHLAP